ncbi:MAG: lipopolysaccharide biosynthesis protein [Polyangiales bacterium]
MTARTQRALSATFWSALDVLVRQGLQFVVSMVLARLLSPREFGTMALLQLFIGIATAFVDSGLSSALIQAEHVTHEDESTVFWFNAAVGLVVALLMAASAPLIAAGFSVDVLAPLTIAMAANVFMSALGAINATLLTKRLDFRSQMQVGSVAAVIAGAAAIAAAARGWGVWALAVQALATSTLTTLGLWIKNAWRPAFTFSLASARRLLGFGGFMLGSSLLDTAYNRLYTLIIGKLYGVVDLGQYNRADSTKQLPAGVLASIFSRVAIPVFATAAHDPPALKRGVRSALRAMMLINTPMMLGMAATAEPIVRTLFGDAWLPSVPAMQVLCVGAVAWPMHVVNLNALLAQGHSHLFFRIEVFKKLLGVVLLAGGAVFGVMGIAWSQVIFSLLGYFLNAYYAKPYLDYGIPEQLRDVTPVVGVSVVMAWLVHGFAGHLHAEPPLVLLVLSALGAALFFAFSFLFRLTALRDMIELYGRARPRQSTK